MSKKVITLFVAIPLLFVGFAFKNFTNSKLMVDKTVFKES